MPIVDAATLDVPENVAKSHTLRYSKLYCKLLQPPMEAVYEVLGIKNPQDNVLTRVYKRYSLPFVSAYCQVQRLLLRHRYLLIGDFTLRKPAKTEDDLRFLLGFGYFLNQLGSKVIVLLDPAKDGLFSYEITRDGMFRRGVVRAVVGATLQERHDRAMERVRAEWAREQRERLMAQEDERLRRGLDPAAPAEPEPEQPPVGIVALQEEFGFDTDEATVLVDKYDLIRSAYAGVVTFEDE